MFSAYHRVHELINRRGLFLNVFYCIESLLCKDVRWPLTRTVSVPHVYPYTSDRIEYCNPRNRSWQTILMFYLFLAKKMQCFRDFGSLPFLFIVSISKTKAHNKQLCLKFVQLQITARASRR